MHVPFPFLVNPLSHSHRPVVAHISLTPLHSLVIEHAKIEYKALNVHKYLLPRPISLYPPISYDLSIYTVDFIQWTNFLAKNWQHVGYTRVI